MAEGLTLESITKHPTYRPHPAIAAGEVGIWNDYFARSHQDLTGLMENVLAVRRTAEKVT